jgi:hypothetical protein
LDFGNDLGWNLISTPIQVAAGAGVFGDTARAILDAVKTIQNERDRIKKVVELFQTAKVETLVRQYSLMGTNGNQPQIATVTVTLLWKKDTGEFAAIYQGQVGSELNGAGKVSANGTLQPFQFTITGKAKIVKKGGIFGYFQYDDVEVESISNPSFLPLR